MQGPQVLKLPL